MDKLSIDQITPELIRKAEDFRKSGNNAEAAKLTEPALGLEDYASLNEDKVNLTLAALRIYGTAKVSLSNGSEKAPEVAEELNFAKKVLDLISENPNLANAVKELKENFDGQPDDFEAEFGRLEAKYLITLSCLTGDASFLNIASEILDKIGEKSEEATARTLAIYEAARIRFKSDKSREEYSELSKKYKDAYKAAFKADNWERAATESAWYVVDSLSTFQFTGAAVGMFDYVKSITHDISNWSIILRQLGKATIEGRRHKGWIKSTPKDADYSKTLKL